MALNLCDEAASEEIGTMIASDPMAYNSETEMLLAYMLL